jgi:hypothetical protein
MKDRYHIAVWDCDNDPSYALYYVVESRIEGDWYILNTFFEREKAEAWIKEQEMYNLHREMLLSMLAYC